MSFVELYIGLGIICFIASYSIGRITHMYWGHWNNPHHWIYGVALILIGLFVDFDRAFLTIIALTVGAGLFISDFDDFRALRFYGPDIHDKKRFFGFD